MPPKQLFQPPARFNFAGDAQLEPILSPHGEVTRQLLQAVTGGLLP